MIVDIATFSGFQIFQQVAPAPCRMNWIQVGGETSTSEEDSKYIFSESKHIPTDEHAKTPDFQKWKGIAIEKYELEAARTQAAGQNSSDSKYFSCLSTTTKLLPTEEHGFQIFQQVAPAPCRMNWIQVGGETSTSEEDSKYIFSESKHIPTDEHAKTPDFQKWKGIAIEKYELEAARTQAAGQNSSDSKYFSCLSTTTKLLPTEEHGFQIFQQVAPAPCRMNWIQVGGETSTSEEDSKYIFSESKHIPTDEHAKTPDFQKWKGIAIEKYELEAARTQAAGQNSSDSKYFSCLSTTTKLLPTEEHDFQKWKDIASEPYMLEASKIQAAGGNSSDSKYVSCLSTTSEILPPEKHDFQNWKESSIEPCMLEAASTQAAGENSFDSEYVTFLSTTSKPHPIEEHDFQKWKSIITKKYMLEAARTQAAVVNSSDSEYFTCVSTSSKLLPTEERDFQYWKESAIAPYMLEAARENSSDSEYFSCLSPPSKTLPTDEYDFQKRKGIATEPFILEATRTQAAEENSCDSKYFTCLSTSSKLIPPEECGLQKFQEIVPKSYMLEPVRDQAAGDNSSSSDYLTSISFDSTLTPNDNQETSESSSYVSYPESHSTSVESKLEESEYSSSLAYNELPVYLANNPCTCSKKRKRERIMKVYYMHVRMKRGVAVLEDTEDESQPPCKKTKMKTIAFPETIHTEENLSDVSTEELLTESDLSFDDVVQEASEDNDRPIDLPPLETSSRAKTPEWLVAHDSGYRCMACCRVFPSLEILQDHVKNGIKEGFSCHSFHVALNLLRSKNRNRKKEVYEEEENKVKKSWTKGISIQCHNIIRHIRDFFHNNH
ncbi:uncharacterized protein LOC124101204 isoform X2 [Marmota monax]|uniref:uncharacterized protein LOC124101204 isoform X2 n=1 Tax=Marmota monax TaxID=9995 RepID=UPI001EB03122|nr:uncharacterized protein LOC124101204 isoform X2 [Marmota monax]